MTAALYYTAVEIRKNEENREQRTDREFNYRGHLSPVDRRGERANSLVEFYFYIMVIHREFHILDFHWMDRINLITVGNKSRRW